VETVYFLKQVAASTSNQQTITLLRRIMTSMPVDLQTAMRDSLRRTM
jgi:hypothetical protein